MDYEGLEFGLLGFFKKMIALLQGFVLVFVSLGVDEMHLHLTCSAAGMENLKYIAFWSGWLPEYGIGMGAGDAGTEWGRPGSGASPRSHLRQDRRAAPSHRDGALAATLCAHAT